MTIQANQSPGVSVFGATSAGGGGGGTPGGTSGQIQYNNGGAFGGLDVYYSSATLRLGAADVSSGAVAQTLQVQSNTGAGTTGPNFTIKGSAGTTAGGSIIFQTAATTSYSTALTINSSQQSVFAAGTKALPSVAFSGNTAGLYSRASGYVTMTDGTREFCQLSAVGSLFSGNIGLKNGAADYSAQTADVLMFCEAADTLALRRTTTAGPVTYPQTFRVYNNFDGTVGGNNEYGTFDWSTSANVLTIGSVKSGIATARNTQLISAARLTIVQNSTEYLAFQRGTNAPSVFFDMGYATFNARLGSNMAFGWSSGTDALSNNLDTFLVRGAASVIGFNGSTASFPALKQSGATLIVRLANDSANAALTCGTTTAAGTALNVTGTGDASIMSVTNTSTGTLLSVVNSSSSTIFSVTDTVTTGTQVIGTSFGLSGNISAAAWTTSGIRYRNVAATLTDTSSTGTVTTGYTDVFGGNTIASQNSGLTSITFTNYATMRIAAPVAGTRVTITNPYSLSLGGSIQMDGGANINLSTTTGTKIGTATNQLLGFYNASPIAQPASANQAAVATTAATQTTPYGYSTQAQADAIITLLNEMRTTLVNLGLMKGSA